ncbi:MAG: glycosyltransferase family 2 protein [Acidobacteriota bacterium]|nr:glycosyltransferase family 2 protein [Acidobacteriota bacterium]
MSAPQIAIVVPTRNRARYLDVALASLQDQEAAPESEIVVVDDGSSDDTRQVAVAHGVRVVGHERALGLNAARNTGVRASTASLVAFVDDDVLAPPGWLRALADGSRRHAEADAFGGPIRARLEGRAPRGCGGEKPPITTLDLGRRDRVAEVVWGANMAIRREALERVGPFDETIGGHGDEEDWLLRLRDSGGSIVYLAGAGLEHRRAGADSRLRSLARAAYHRGRAARRSDQRRLRAPGLRIELRTLGGCVWHAVRRRCPQGLIMGAHAAGRIREALVRAPRSGTG